MSAFKRLLFVFSSGIVVMSSSFVQAETLQEAVQYMLKSHPEVRAQSYNRLARDLEVRQAKAGYLPTIDVYAGTGFNRQHQPDYDTTYQDRAVISVRQNVFRFFGTQSEVERQEARVRSQAYLLQGTSENIALRAARVYLGVLRQQELYDLAQENLVNHKRILDQVKLRSESGIDRKADFDQVMGRVALAQSNLVASQANSIDANTDYQAVVGHLPGYLTKPEPVGPAIPATMEEAEKIAVQNNPTIKSAKADLEARNSQYEAARSQLYPSFDIALDYKWQNDVDIPGDESGFLAMASVSFNVFNGGWNKARIGQTTYEIYEAQEISDNAKRETIQSVRLAWESFKGATDRIVYLEEYVKSAGLTAESFAAQWNIGRRTMFDLLDTQAEYINAKASLVNAKYDKMYSEYRVLSAMGKLVPFLQLDLPEQSRVLAASNATAQ